MSRRPLMIAAGVVVLVLVGWYVLVWSPQSSNLRAAKAAVVKADASHQKLVIEVAELGALRRTLPAQIKILDEAVPAVPVDPGIASIIDQVQAASTSAGVTLTSESQQLGALAATGSSSEASSAASTITLSLAVGGTYQQVRDFVIRLEQLERLVVVDTLSLSPTSSTVAATITARAFYDPTPVPNTSKLDLGT
jgi:type IV pilus assembly protein PilO